MKPIVVNLYGGPSTGKSTTAASVFYNLKQAGINCEMAREYAKDVVWKGAETILNDQNYIFAKQNNKLHYLSDKVDVIITDSPLLLSLVYGDLEPETFKAHVRATYEGYNNMNIMLRRVKPFNPAGRLQGELEAKLIDVKCQDILDAECKLDYHVFDADDKCGERIANQIIKELQAPQEVETLKSTRHTLQKDESLEIDSIISYDDLRISFSKTRSGWVIEQSPWSGESGIVDYEEVAFIETKS